MNQEVKGSGPGLIELAEGIRQQLADLIEAERFGESVGQLAVRTMQAKIDLNRLGRIVGDRIVEES